MPDTDATVASLPLHRLACSLQRQLGAERVIIIAEFDDQIGTGFGGPDDTTVRDLLYMFASGIEGVMKLDSASQGTAPCPAS